MAESPLTCCVLCLHSVWYVCWSVRIAWVYYCHQLTVCRSVCLCLSHSFKLLILFCFSMESSHFWLSVLHVPLYKTVFFDFWFRTPEAQNLLPKICTKSPMSRLVWQIDRRCLGLPGGFGDGRFNGTMQNVVGPTLVAMATKFGLGAEIQSPSGLSQNIVNTISWEVFAPDSHQWCITRYGRTRHFWGSKGQRSRSQWNKMLLERTVLGVVNTISWKCWKYFHPNWHQLCTIWDRDEWVIFLVQEVKGQGHLAITCIVIPHLQMCACDWSKLRHTTFTKSSYFPHESILPPL